MTKRMLMPFALMLALTVTGPFAPGESKDQQRMNAKNALTAQVMSMLVPQQCFSSGSGATFLKICITNNGNISWLESPAGKVHLQSREGYAICSDIGYPNKTVHGFDANIASNGWGVSAVSQPGGVGTFPLIITRQSLDGFLQFKQTFTFNSGERGIDVVMDIKNISATVLPNVVMSRYFDGDVDGSVTNTYSATRDSDWGRGPDGRGLMLTSAPSAVVSFTGEGMKYSDWDPFGVGQQYARGCGYAGPNPNNVGDFVGGLHLDLLDLYPNQTRTVTLRYRRF